MTVAKGAQSSVATAHLTPAQLAAATNLPVQTIQRWEKRYRFPDGARSPGRHRRYADEDVARVLRVVALRDSGMGLQEAIRVVSAGDDPGAPRTQTSAERSDRIGQLRADGLEALAELDEARLWRILAEAQARFDAPEVICQLIIPLIRTTDDPTNLRRPERIQAFFFSRIVTATLSSMAARASGSSPRPGSGRTVWVACPEGEAHEVGALSAVALLAARGVDARYLGANVPSRHPAGGGPRASPRRRRALGDPLPGDPRPARRHGSPRRGDPCLRRRARRVAGPGPRLPRLLPARRPAGKHRHPRRRAELARRRPRDSGHEAGTDAQIGPRPSRRMRGPD